MSHTPIRSKPGRAAVERMRKLCQELPEFEEKEDQLGHTGFRVRDKPFVLMGEDAGGIHLSMKVEHATQQRLARTESYRVTPYVGRHGWVSCTVDKDTDWEQIKGFVLEAYRRVAPKTIIKKL